MMYNEDCYTTQNREIKYDYVLTSPPDYEEIGMKPGDDNYGFFLSKRLTNLTPSNGYMTIFMPDRKCNGSLIQKHAIVNSIMENMGWRISTQKIWVKSTKVNLYRFNYTYIMTFFKNPSIKINPSLPDVFVIPFEKHKKYNDNFVTEVINPFILGYTKQGQTIYDPFMGSRTTAIGCLNNGRDYIGSEIVKEVFDMSIERITQWKEEHE